MPTPLTKTITRRGLIPHRGRRMVVTLVPGDLIGVRPERTRTTFYLPIMAAYSVAVKMHVAAQKAVKQALREERKKARR